MQDAREAGSHVPPEADCSTDDTKENSTRDNCYGDFFGDCMRRNVSRLRRREHKHRAPNATICNTDYQ